MMAMTIHPTPPSSPGHPLSTSGNEAEHHWLHQQVDHLLVAVEHELRAAGPTGLSELALIRALQSDRWALIGPVAFHEPDRLYPVHFLLFHVLYRLRDQIGESGESLQISPGCLRISSSVPIPLASSLPGSPDALRAFYLDLSQYFMSEATIRDMMDRFWSGAAARKPDTPSAVNAGKVLGLDPLPVEFSTVKQRFRKLVMRAHPDRGGDTGEVQKLNQAFSLLKAHYA